MSDESLDGADDAAEGGAPRGGIAHDVLDYLAKQIVDDPESVVIEAEERRRGGTMLRLHVAPDDMGKIIGKRGRVAQAVRQVVRAAAAHDNADVAVDIVD